MLPILVFAGSLVCLGNLLGLGLFLLAYRRQTARQRELLHRTRDDFQEAINQILDRYQALRASVESEERETPEFATVATTSLGMPSLEEHSAANGIARAAVVGTGINFSKRAQIVRLHRQGEAPVRIAAAVGIPRAEVELIVKLHRATQTSAVPNPSRP